MIQLHAYFTGNSSKNEIIIECLLVHSFTSESKSQVDENGVDNVH